MTDVVMVYKERAYAPDRQLSLIRKTTLGRRGEVADAYTNSVASEWLGCRSQTPRPNSIASFLFSPYNLFSSLFKEKRMFVRCN
jgi:hypothetical protein